MTTTAIAFLIVAVVVIWGGLAASITLLRRDARAIPDDDVDEVLPTGDQGPPPPSR